MRRLRSARDNATESRDPYYLEIANDLRERLLSGKYRPGQRFFSIRGLIKETQRSLPTVRSALGVLIRDGLLEARQGSGYYVTARVESANHSTRGFRNFLAVIPSSTVPDEPWFTGRIGLGMIQAANVDHAVVSFYKRQAHARLNDKRARSDLDRILAMRPDGIAWLHSVPEDTEILREIRSRNLPLVTTMRHLPGMDLPLIREDDLVYASTVLANFEARGHRRIGIILRELEDEYFRSKVDAIREAASSSQISVSEQDFFFMPSGDPDPSGELQVEPLRKFLEARPHLTGLMVLAATGIRPVIKLFDSAMGERMKKISIIYNILDGVAVPTLPTGENLATITPPLEKLGGHLVHSLTAMVKKEQPVALPRLVPIFQAGESLRNV